MCSKMQISVTYGVSMTIKSQELPKFKNKNSI